ncbi:MAG: hypothetical protein JWL74_1274 [Alphaproteobacteria bacterium]|jgi:cell division septation protein DedD|nr:hypothetical protein [Alphaproteobacteria bacterium]
MVRLRWFNSEEAELLGAMALVAFAVILLAVMLT